MTQHLKSSTIVLISCWTCCLLNLALAGAASEVQVLRIVRSYANGVFLHCPLTSPQAHDLAGVYQLKWLNEKDDYNKADDQVQVSDYNVMLVADANLQINQQLTYVSCGFINNYRYVRIKLWHLVFIDNPSVDISITNNAALIDYTPVNSTCSSVSAVANVNPLTWSRPCDLLRIKCKNNFDHPINTRYVWMYIYNPLTYTYEIWHKYDVDNENEDNIYQLFYNPSSNKKMYLYEFIQLLFSRGDDYRITFQCGSYYEESYNKEKICLIANSLNVTIIKGEQHYHHKPYSTDHDHSVNTGLLIGVIIASILAFLFLLGLLGFLIWCCCCRKRSARTNTKHTASSSIIFPAVNTSSCSTTTTCHQAEIEHHHHTASYNNMLSANHLHHQSMSNLNNAGCIGAGAVQGGGNNYLCSQSSSHMMADKGSQFTNQMDCSGANVVSSNTGVCSKPPDVYLSMLTIHKDACDDDEINGGHLQQQCQEEFISAYHHHTNYGLEAIEQNQQHYQQYDDSGICQRNNYIQNCRPQQTEYNFHYV